VNRFGFIVHACFDTVSGLLSTIGLLKATRIDSNSFAA
jgi:hypothetical protein